MNKNINELNSSEIVLNVLENEELIEKETQVITAKELDNLSESHSKESTLDITANNNNSVFNTEVMNIDQKKNSSYKQQNVILTYPHSKETIETGECMPSDADYYSWWEIISSELHSSEIEDRSDETGEYCVNVQAWIAVSSGDQDDEVDENVAPALRTIHVQIDRDEIGDYYVAGVEE